MTRIINDTTRAGCPTCSHRFGDATTGTNRLNEGADVVNLRFLERAASQSALLDRTSRLFRFSLAVDRLRTDYSSVARPLAEPRRTCQARYAIAEPTLISSIPIRSLISHRAVTGRLDHSIAERRIPTSPLANTPPQLGKALW